MIDAKQAREQTDIANSTKGELARLSRMIQEASRDGKCYIETNHSLNLSTIEQLTLASYDVTELPGFKHYRIEW